MGGFESQIDYKLGEQLGSSKGTVFQHYHGTHKITSQRASIFALFTQKSSPSHVEASKNYAKCLRTLKHPNILRVECIEEKSDVIYFATERVSTLAEYRIKNKLNEQLISLGIYQVTSALSFLNNECSLVHVNISPNSIFVNEEGDWKIGGFELCYNGTEPIPMSILELKELIDKQFVEPNIFEGQLYKLSGIPATVIDSFSLGNLIFWCFSELNTFSNLNFPMDRTRIASRLPLLYRNPFKKLINPNIETRLTTVEFLNDKAFANEFVETVFFLDNILLKNDYERKIFIKNLSTKIDNLPQSCQKKLLPQLLKAVNTGISSSDLLKIILKITKSNEITEENYSTIIVPTLIKLFASNERAVRVCLLENIDQIIPKIPSDVINNIIFTHIASGFQDSSVCIRELTVKSMIFIIPMLSIKNIKSQALVHLAQLQNDPEPAVRTNTTVCLGKIVSLIKDQSIRNLVLRSAFNRALNDKFAPTRISALISFSANIDYFSIENCAKIVIPAVVPFIIDPSKGVRNAALSCANLFIKRLEKYSLTMNDSGISEEERPVEDPFSETTKQSTKIVSNMGSWALKTFVGLTDIDKTNVNQTIDSHENLSTQNIGLKQSTTSTLPQYSSTSQTVANPKTSNTKNTIKQKTPLIYSDSINKKNANPINQNPTLKPKNIQKKIGGGGGMKLLSKEEKEKISKSKISHSNNNNNMQTNNNFLNDFSEDEDELNILWGETQDNSKKNQNNKNNNLKTLEDDNVDLNLANGWLNDLDISTAHDLDTPTSTSTSTSTSNLQIQSQTMYKNKKRQDPFAGLVLTQKTSQKDTKNTDQKNSDLFSAFGLTPKKVIL